MPRTGENIYKRKDGRFEGRYITGYDENGKAKYASVYGYSKPEVREKMRQKKGETGYVSFDKGKTVREVALEWLATKKDSVASTTYRRYEEALERSIYSEYGDMPISEISEAEIEDFAKRVAEKRSQKGMGASLSTLQMSSGVLSMLVDYANGKPEKPSLMVFADERKEFQSLDASEIERICNAAKYNETPEMLAVLLALFCGIRPGEACALHWRDVSIDGKQIYVHQSAHRVKTDDSSEYKTEMRIEEIPTKTHIRTVNVPDEIVEYIYYNSKHKIHIREFENLIKRIYGIHRNSCVCKEREDCGNFMAFTPNGTVCFCDAYEKDSKEVGNIKDGDIVSIIQSNRYQDTRKEYHLTADTTCKDCKWKCICGCGCARSDVISKNGNHSNYFCLANKALCEHILEVIKGDARLIEQNKNIIESLKDV